MVRSQTSRKPPPQIPCPAKGNDLPDAETRQRLQELRASHLELEKKNEELRRVQADLDAARTRYFDLYNLAPAGYCLLDDGGLILEANLTAAAFLDVPRTALVQQPLSQFICKEDLNAYAQHRQRLFETGAPQACELRMTKGDGSLLWAHLAATLVQHGEGAPACRIVLSDITPYKQMEQSLQRLYVVLAQVNQAIVHFQKRDELLREVCRIAIKAGRFRMAWVGLLDAPTRQLKPIAHDGHEEGYLKSIHVNVNPDSAFSQGPIGQAFLRNQVVASNDFDPAFQRSPWRDERAQRGYRAIVAVPFRLKDEVIGTLNLYVDAPCFFSEEEMDLLKRIGDTLSFALDCLEIEKSRQRAEAALRESEAQNRALIHAIPDLIFINRRDGEYLAVHAPDPRLLAAPHGTILHRKIAEFLPKPVAERCLEAIATALDSGALQELTYSIPIDGQERHFEARMAPCTHDTVLTIVRDITCRKQAEAARREPEQLIRQTPNRENP